MISIDSINQKEKFLLIHSVPPPLMLKSFLLGHFYQMTKIFVERAVETLTQSSKLNAHHLILYYKPDCPYCKLVLEFLKEKGRNIPLYDTNDPSVKEELIAKGGKSQVPCLFINGKALYESSDIIRWLKEHF